MPTKRKIDEVAQLFGQAHKEEAEWKKQKDKWRKQFFDLIAIPEEQLARQTIYIDAEDAELYVATLYPKWRILKKDKLEPLEWRVIIEEDPTKKTYQYVNPRDNQVYTRTVAESAPEVDLERMALDNSQFWYDVTFQPKPPRELRPLEELDEEQLDKLKNYLLPPKLTNRMEKPRKAKPEELEEIEPVHKCTEFMYDSRRDVCCKECGQLK
jgi:hypothetical protein